MPAESTEPRREFWARHVGAWRTSGLSQQAYCAREGLRPSTFGWWRWRLAPAEAAGGSRATAPRMVAVRVRESASGSGFELRLAGERRLHIPSDFDEGALRRLLRVLESGA
jgi:hypothetical protein